MKTTMYPYVSVTRNETQAVLRVRANETHDYPLTKNGCLQAGRDLFNSGAESWLCSSSVDFPEEVKKSFKHDIRELLDQGFQEEQEKIYAPRKSLIKKMLDFCKNSNKFILSLTDEEYEWLNHMDQS